MVRLDGTAIHLEERIYIYIIIFSLNNTTVIRQRPRQRSRKTSHAFVPFSKESSELPVGLQASSGFRETICHML